MDILVNSDFNLLPYSVPAEIVDRDDFTTYINTVVTKELKKLLGLTLYDLFVAAIAEEYPEDNWVELVSGGRYFIGDIQYEWMGFTEALKPCVYAQHLRDRYDNDTESGITISKVENAEVISPALQIVNAYNAYVNSIGSIDSVKNTFYGYMQANLETYPTWVFEAPKLINRFNL